tara:strand:- start:79 stop:591 length:513 start_codon:yes stop_codon:yes gene_type:complete
MTEEIFRNYLEIKSLKDLNEVKTPSNNYYLDLVNPKDFQLNRFFYKQIGKKYNWFDRLVWNDQNWINYISKSNVLTYVLKYNNELVGFSELILNQEKNEMEIAYLGILEEYFGKKLGGFLLSELVKKSFIYDIKRVWVHTCSLDHKHALKNYLSRGMKVFKSEIVKKQIA